METWEGDNNHAPEFKMPKPINTAPSPTLTAAISATRIEMAKMVSPAEDGQPLSPMGRLFHKPESNMYIVSIVGTKTWIDPDHFKLNIIPFHIYPRFNCVQVPDETGDQLKWAKTEAVDLEQHVFTHFINSEDINSLGGADKYTEEYLYELTKTSIDMSKPLWDVHILNLSEPTSQGAMAVIFVRFHHSIGDGMSLMSFFLSLSRKASNPNTPPSLPVLFKKPLKSQSTLKFVWWFMCFVWNTLVDIVDILATAFFLVDTPNPLKGPDDAGKNPRRIVMRTLSMDDVMLVKAVTKTTINDVVMGAAEAGLTRYLNRSYGELGNKEERKIQKNGNNLPKNLRVRGAILFNVRVLPGFQPIGSMMEKGSSAKWGNRVGHILYPLSVNKLHDDNPLEYVFKANAVMNRKKASLGSYFSYYFGNFIINTFGIKLASLPTNTSFWFSNMPGPQEEITMFGYPVAFVGCSCYGQPIALFIHAISYADKLNFIISVDEDTIPDPHQLCDDLEQSFELIKNAAVVKRCREKQE